MNHNAEVSQTNRIEDVDMAHEMALAANPLLCTELTLRELAPQYESISRGIMHLVIGGGARVPFFNIDRNREDMMTMIENAQSSLLVHADEAMDSAQEAYLLHQDIAQKEVEYGDSSTLDLFSGTEVDYYTKPYDEAEDRDKKFRLERAIRNKQKLAEILELTASPLTVEDLSPEQVTAMLKRLDTRSQ